jgi:four helix bundle protein
MGDYRSLKVWQRAHRLTLLVYKATQHFPSSELYGLTSQLRRSAASVPANLAEGAGRNSVGELRRFCRISLGSASELEYHLLLARELGYLPTECHAGLAEEVDHLKRMLARLASALEANERKTDNG